MWAVGVSLSRGLGLFHFLLLFARRVPSVLARGPAAVQAWPLLVVSTIGTGRAPPVGGGPPFDVVCTGVEGGYRLL